MKISYKYPFFTLYKKGGNSTMKRILKKSVMLSLVLACLFSENVLARDMEKYNVAKNTYVNTGLLPKKEKTAYDRIQGIEKSTAMGAAISSITNEPKGVIRVFAETAMFKPVDWACLTIYLERWYEEEKCWQIEAEFEKEFLPEEQSDGELTTATLSVSISNQPMGYYYRVRAMHELEFDGDWYEARVTKTDGVFMEYIP